MENKRGQITIFIIIGIIIVVIALFFFLVFPKIKYSIESKKSAQGYMQTCIEDTLKDNVKKISLQGGSLNPTLFSTYDNVNIRNLCYSAEYCKLGTLQEPQLEPAIEREIKNSIEQEVESCFESMKNSYEKKGYSADLKNGEVNVNILPQQISVDLNASLTLEKGSAEKYDSFVVVLNNNLYELIAIANNILEREATVGDTDVTLYMDIYPQIQVKKRSMSDGTKIYLIIDRNTQDKFQIASRSLVLSPSGYC
jgi:hypothetical protein